MVTASTKKLGMSFLTTAISSTADLPFSRSTFGLRYTPLAGRTNSSTVPFMRLVLTIKLHGLAGVDIRACWGSAPDRRSENRGRRSLRRQL